MDDENKWNAIFAAVYGVSAAGHTSGRRRAAAAYLTVWYFFPGGGIVPVELKAPGRKGKLSKSQQLQIKRLAAVGTKVYVLSTQEEVDKFMQKHITAYGLPE